jgi:hypothetical protein
MRLLADLIRHSFHQTTKGTFLKLSRDVHYLGAIDGVAFFNLVFCVGCPLVATQLWRRGLNQRKKQARRGYRQLVEVLKIILPLIPVGFMVLIQDRQSQVRLYWRQTNPRKAISQLYSLLRKPLKTFKYKFGLCLHST